MIHKPIILDLFCTTDCNILELKAKLRYRYLLASKMILFCDLFFHFTSIASYYSIFVYLSVGSVMFLWSTFDHRTLKTKFATIE